jgi:hypothetical protein
MLRALPCNPQSALQYELTGTLFGLTVTYLVPLACVLMGGTTTWFAGAAWGVMTIAYAPMLRLIACRHCGRRCYRLSR